MKYLESFKDNIYNSNISDIFNKKLISKDIEGFNNIEDAEQYINDMISIDFPYGLRNIPPQPTFYRVLLVENIESINKKRLGLHYISNINVIYDIHWYYSIGMEDALKNIKRGDSDNEIFLCTIKIDRDDIDLDGTITQRMNFPYEFEFLIHPNPKSLIITNIKKINPIDIK